jgi:hypothetical protein
MITDFIIKFPFPFRGNEGYAYLKKFSCPLEMYLFRARHATKVLGIACFIA